MGPTLVFVSGVVAFCMAWAIGAQDVSNALGTSVGSKALTVRQAIIVGAVCEFTGSLVGGEVAATISGGILQMDTFRELGAAGVDVYAHCMFVTMCGAFAWLAVATYYGLPVSTTHSLVGGLVGVGCVAMSADGVNWASVGRIVSSWVSSPLLGGIIAYAVFGLIHAHVLVQPSPQKAARAVLPYFTGFTIGLLTMFMGVAGPRSYRVDPFTAVLGGCAAGAVAGVATRMRNQGGEEDSVEFITRIIPDDGDEDAEAGEVSPAPVPTLARTASQAQKPVPTTKLEQAEASFKSLMVLTACVVAFAHGSNDVSNSIGPFNALVEIYTNGNIRPGAPVPLWVLLCGGIGIVVGLATYGYKVMATVGEGIAKLTFTRGFAAQIATAATVLTATQVGVSVSTTHCLIGAIAGVALVEGPDKLNKATLKKIAMSWIITLPCAAAFSVVLYAVFVTLFAAHV